MQSDEIHRQLNLLPAIPVDKLYPRDHEIWEGIDGDAIFEVTKRQLFETQDVIGLTVRGNPSERLRLSGEFTAALGAVASADARLDELNHTDAFGWVREKQEASTEKTFESIATLEAIVSIFSENTEITEATKNIEALLINTSASEAATVLAWQEYASLVGAFVEKNTNDSADERALIQIKAIIHQALIYYRTGNVRGYITQLDSAEEYAFHMQLDSIRERVATASDEAFEYYKSLK